MSVSPDQLIELAQGADGESDLLDFKQEYTPEKKAGFWAETVKDIVAFANTRGGIIVFGISDNGNPSGIDCSQLFTLDNAALSDQIRKYTGFDLPGLSINKISRSGNIYPAILIESISVPLVFTKVGTYEYEKDKQKTAFSVGTIYFRHGSKSEPGNRADIASCIDRRLRHVREEWLGNIRKVVEAEPGATVVVTHSSSAGGAVRITNDPNAPAFRLPKLSDGYPHKQSEVIKEVNSRLRGETNINTHDIQTIKCFEDINEKATPNFVSRPHEKSSPQYSPAFIDMIVRRYRSDAQYFEKCRDHWRRHFTNHPSSTHL